MPQPALTVFLIIAAIAIVAVLDKPAGVNRQMYGIIDLQKV